MQLLIDIHKHKIMHILVLPGYGKELNLYTDAIKNKRNNII